MRNGSDTAEIDPRRFRLRSRFVLGLLAAFAVALLLRAVDLQVLNQHFLERQGDRRYMREARMPASRGAILDRFGEPLAVSSPVDSVWVNPKEIGTDPERIDRLARALQRDRQWLAQRISLETQDVF